MKVRTSVAEFHSSGKSCQRHVRSELLGMHTNLGILAADIQGIELATLRKTQRHAQGGVSCTHKAVRSKIQQESLQASPVGKGASH